MYSYYFIWPPRTCSCAASDAVHPRRTKHDKQSWPQHIASTPDAPRAFGCNRKGCRLDFSCLRQPLITGTDTPLMHFRNSVLFPGWWWSCHSGRANTLKSCFPAFSPWDMRHNPPCASPSDQAFGKTWEEHGRSHRLQGRRQGLW